MDFATISLAKRQELSGLGALAPDVLQGQQASVCRGAGRGGRWPEAKLVFPELRSEARRWAHGNSLPGLGPPDLRGSNRGTRCFYLFIQTSESFGVSAEIGSGVVRGGPDIRFHEGCSRVPRGSARARGWCEH